LCSTGAVRGTSPHRHWTDKTGDTRALVLGWLVALVLGVSLGLLLVKLGDAWGSFDPTDVPEVPETVGTTLHFGPVRVSPEGDILRVVSDGATIWVERWEGSCWGKGGCIGRRATEAEMVRRGNVAVEPTMPPRPEQALAPEVIGDPVLSGDQVLRLVVEFASGEDWVEVWGGSRWVKPPSGSGPLADFVAGRRLTDEELVQRGIVASDPTTPMPRRDHSASG
jgi:hypothetical protein